MSSSITCPPKIYKFVGLKVFVNWTVKLDWIYRGFLDGFTQLNPLFGCVPGCLNPGIWTVCTYARHWSCMTNIPENLEKKPRVRKWWDWQRSRVIVWLQYLFHCFALRALFVCIEYELLSYYISLMTGLRYRSDSSEIIDRENGFESDTVTGRAL